MLPRYNLYDMYGIYWHERSLKLSWKMESSKKPFIWLSNRHKLAKGF